MLPSDEEMITETLEAINQLPVAMGRRILSMYPSNEAVNAIAFILGVNGYSLTRTLIFYRNSRKNKYRALYDRYPELAQK